MRLPKRPSDPAELAHLLGRMATGEIPNDSDDMGRSPLLDLIKAEQERENASIHPPQEGIPNDRRNRVRRGLEGSIIL